MQPKSYLVLEDKLSQAWINTYTICLLLVLVKLIFFYFSISQSMKTVQNLLLSQCGTIDKYFSLGIQNTPHYLGLAGNYLITKSLEESVKASLLTLKLLVYASEELIEFLVDFYLGTYECLLVSAIDGTVNVATNATEVLIDVVNKTIGAATNDLDDGLNDISKFVNNVISDFKKVEKFFKGNKDDDNYTSSILKVNLTIDGLRHVSIPSSVDEKLDALAAKTPNFSKLKNETKELISIPFKKIIKELGNSNVSKYIGDSDLLYVPKIQEANSEGICSSNKDNIKHLFHDLTKALKVATVICIVLTLIGAIVCTIPVIWREYKIWQCLDNMKGNFDLKQEVRQKEVFIVTDTESDKTFYYNFNNSKSSFSTEIKTSPDFDIIESYESSFHYWNSKITTFISRIIVNLKRQGKANREVNDKIQIQWLVAYVFSTRACFLLGIAILCIIACIFQFIILSVFRNLINGKQNMHFLKKVSTSNTLTNTLKTELSQWSNSTNDYINYTETSINKDIFGWVEETTTSVNGTVNKMIKGIDTTLADLFNGTLLYHPMKAVVGCIIEDKLYTIRNGLTWVHDKAEIHLPKINVTEIHNVLLVGSTNGVKNTTTNYNNTMTNNTTNSTLSTLEKKVSTESEKLALYIHSALLQILEEFYKTTIYELIIALILLFLWMIQIPIGLLRLHFHYG